MGLSDAKWPHDGIYEVGEVTTALRLDGPRVSGRGRQGTSSLYKSQPRHSDRQQNQTFILLNPYKPFLLTFPYTVQKYYFYNYYYCYYQI